MTLESDNTVNDEAGLIDNSEARGMNAVELRIPCCGTNKLILTYETENLGEVLGVINTITNYLGIKCDFTFLKRKGGS